MKNGLKNPEKVYRKVASTMEMEQFSLTKSDATRIINCISGKKTFSETKKELIQKHTKQVSNG